MNRYRVHYQVNDRDYTWEGYADNRQKILAKFERNVAAKHKSEEKLTVTQIEEQTIIRVEVTGFKDELQGAAQPSRRPAIPGQPLLLFGGAVGAYAGAGESAR